MARLTVSTLLLFALAILAPAQDGGELRWRWRKGESLKYKFTHRELRTVEIGDQKSETITQTEFDWRWMVREIDDKGIAALEMKPTALRVSSNGKDFEFSYDSGKGERGTDDYKKRLSNLYDQVLYTGKYSLRLRATGDVVELRGLSKVVEDTNPGADIIDFHGQNLRDDVFAWFLQQGLGRLPDRKQAEQGKWKIAVESTLEHLGPVTGEVVFTLKKPAKVGDRVVQEIDVAGSQSLDLDTKWLGNAVKGTLKTTKYTGTLRFDTEAGRLHSGSVQMELAGALKFGNANAANMKVAYRHELELEVQP